MMNNRRRLQTRHDSRSLCNQVEFLFTQTHRSAQLYLDQAPAAIHQNAMTRYMHVLSTTNSCVMAHGLSAFKVA